MGLNRNNERVDTAVSGRKDVSRLSNYDPIQRRDKENM